MGCRFNYMKLLEPGICSWDILMKGPASPGGFFDPDALWLERSRQ